MDLIMPHTTLIPSSQARAKLKQTLACGSYADCIVNALHSSAPAAKLFSLHNDPEYFPLFVGTVYEKSIKSSPYLIRCEKADDPFLDWMLGDGGLSGFIACGRLSFSHAIEHWKNLLTVAFDDGTTAHFRYYDSRVCSSLLYKLKHDESEIFRGPYPMIIVRYTYQLEQENENGVGDSMKTLPLWIHNFSNNDINSHTTFTHDMSVTRYRIKDYHLAALGHLLERVSLANITQHLWNTGMPIHLKARVSEYGTLDSFVKEAASKSGQNGFPASADKMAFILLCLRHGIAKVEKVASLKKSNAEPAPRLAAIRHSLEEENNAPF